MATEGSVSCDIMSQLMAMMAEIKQSQQTEFNKLRKETQESQKSIYESQQSAVAEIKQSQQTEFNKLRIETSERHRDLINQLKSITYRNIEILKDSDSKPKVTENNNSKENVLDETRHSPDDADNTNVHTEREALSQVQSSIQVVMPECSAEIEKAENEVDAKVEKVPDEVKKVHNKMETVQSEVDEVQTEFDSDPELWKTVHSEVQREFDSDPELWKTVHSEVQSEFDSDSELWETAQNEVDEVQREFVSDPEVWDRPTESTSENCELIPAASEVKVGQHIDSCNNFVNAEYLNVSAKQPDVKDGVNATKPIAPHEYQFRGTTYLDSIAEDVEYMGKSEFEWLRLTEFPYDPGGYFVVHSSSR